MKKQAAVVDIQERKPSKRPFWYASSVRSHSVDALTEGPMRPALQGRLSCTSGLVTLEYEERRNEGHEEGAFHDGYEELISSINSPRTENRMLCDLHDQVYIEGVEDLSGPHLGRRAHNEQRTRENLRENKQASGLICHEIYS